VKQKIETFGAAVLHGLGTPFGIIFESIYKNK